MRPMVPRIVRHDILFSLNSAISDAIERSAVTGNLCVEATFQLAEQPWLTATRLAFVAIGVSLALYRTFR